MIRFIHILALSFALICPAYATGGNYKTEHISIMFRDSERGNRRIPIDIYYPVNRDHQGVMATENANERFPVICFGHGYLISGKWYEHIWKMLVSGGYIVIIPGSESGLFPSHRALAKDLGFAISEIYRLDADSSSPLYGRIDHTRCLMGHSMGGGSAFVAASLQDDITAIAVLAPFETKPSAVEAASSVGIPSIIFAGENDCITPPDKHQLPIYNSSASKDKTYVLIREGNHCQMGVSHPKCNKAERISGCSENSISNDDQLKILAKYLIPWLDFFLKGSTESGVLFDSFHGDDTSVVIARSGPLVSASN